MERSILILEMYSSVGGMREYAKIFYQGYGKKTSRQTLFNSYYWLRFCQLAFFRNRILTSKLKGEFDLIHITNNTVFDLFVINYLILKTKSTIVYTLHDPQPHSSHSVLKKILNKLLKKLNIRILSIKNKRFYVHLHSVSNLPCKVDYSNKIIISHPYSIVNKEVNDMFDLSSTSKVKLTFVGRIDHYKGLENFINVFSNLNEDVQNKFLLTIAGKGEIKNISQINLLLNKIVLNRFITNDEFDSLIKFSDVIIFPYINATSSGVLSRVLPFNKKVILSNVLGLTEYCAGYENKIVFNSNSELSMILNSISLDTESDINLVNDISLDINTIIKTILSKTL